MMYSLWNDLENLYVEKKQRVSKSYEKVMKPFLQSEISYNSSAMYGMANTLFSNKKMIAFNLIQNAIDEAKGAARVEIIAKRYAPLALKKKMLRHVGDELRHSKQFAQLIKLTGKSFDIDSSEQTEEEIENVFDFDDDLQTFLCRVHSIEIRSWVMLRHYINILILQPDIKLKKAIPVLERILQDELNHVVYTGVQIMQWMEENPNLEDTLLVCNRHTERETWADIANMAKYYAEVSSAGA